MEFKKTKVTRRRFTHYSRLPKDYCRSCGHRGIWEEAHCDDGRWICLPCGEGTPSIPAGHASRLVDAPADQLKVTISEEWEEEVDELRLELEKKLSAMYRRMVLDLYGDGSGELAGIREEVPE